MSDKLSHYIGKFEIFATYTYRKARRNGMDDNQAKAYGYAIAVLGAQAKMKRRTAKQVTSSQAVIKAAATKRKKATITPEMYDRHIRSRVGDEYRKFVRRFDKLVDSGLSYEDIKQLVKIPPTWGAKITTEEFFKRTEKI